MNTTHAFFRIPKLLFLVFFLLSSSAQIVQGSEEASTHLVVLAQSLGTMATNTPEEQVRQAIKWLEDLNENKIDFLIKQKDLLGQNHSLQDIGQKNSLHHNAFYEQGFTKLAFASKEYPKGLNINQDTWNLFQNKIDTTWQNKVIPYAEKLCSSILQAASDFLKNLNIPETIKNKNKPGSHTESYHFSSKARLENFLLYEKRKFLDEISGRQILQQYAPNALKKFEDQLEITWKKLEDAGKIEAEEQIQNCINAIPETKESNKFNNINDLYSHLISSCWDKQKKSPDFTTIEKNEFEDYNPKSREAWLKFKETVEKAWEIVILNRSINQKLREIITELQKEGSIREAIQENITTKEALLDYVLKIIWPKEEERPNIKELEMQKNDMLTETLQNIQGKLDVAFRNLTQKLDTINAEKKRIRDSINYLEQNFSTPKLASKSIKKDKLKTNGDLIKKAFQSGWGTQYDSQPFAKFTKANEFIIFIRKEISKNPNLKSEWEDLETQYLKAWEMIEPPKNPTKS